MLTFQDKFTKRENKKRAANPHKYTVYDPITMAGAEGLEPSARGFGDHRPIRNFIPLKIALTVYYQPVYLSMHKITNI